MNLAMDAVSGAVESLRQLTSTASSAQTPVEGAVQPAAVAQENPEAAKIIAGPERTNEVTEERIHPAANAQPPALPTTTPTFSPVPSASALLPTAIPAPPAPITMDSTPIPSEIDGFSLDNDSLDGTPIIDSTGDVRMEEDVTAPVASTVKLVEPIPAPRRPLFESSSDEEDELLTDIEVEVDQLMEEETPVASTSAVQITAPANSTSANQSNATAGPSGQGSTAAAPRYIVELVKNNSSKNRHIIRLAPGVSDGASSGRPTNVAKNQMIGGKMSWHRVVERGEPKDIGWREKLGDNLARQLEIPQCQSSRFLAERLADDLYALSDAILDSRRVSSRLSILRASQCRQSSGGKDS